MTKRLFRQLILVLSTVSLVLGVLSPIQSVRTDKDSIRVLINVVDGSAYDVFVRSGDSHSFLKRFEGKPIGAYSVIAKVSPDGRHVALIPDFNSSYGTQLIVLSMVDGSEVLTRDGYITDIAWSNEGQILAFVSLDKDSAVFEWVADGSDLSAAIRPSDPIGQVTLTDLTGNETPLTTHSSIVRVLGFSADSTTLYVTRVHETPGFQLEAFSHISITSGEITDVLVSPLDGVFYRGFKLVPIRGGEPQVGLIVSSSMHATGESGDFLSLVNVDGTNRRDIHTGSVRYTDYLWDQDANQVVFSTRHGIWSATAAGIGTAQQLASGLTLNWDLEEVMENGSVLIRNSTGGDLELLRGRRVSLPQPKQIENVGIMATKNNGATYIHQVYDTPTDFKNGGYGSAPQSNGGKQDACGPTSAIIVMAKLRYSPDPVYVSPSAFSPYLGKDPVPSHWSDYGKYVSHQYTHTFQDFDGLPTSVTFSNWDAPYNSGQGAHGHMVIPGIGTVFSDMENFFAMQGMSFSKSWGYNQTWIKTQIDAGRLIIASMKYDNVGGHISVIKGYVTDTSGNITQLILHDTYGNYKYKDGWGYRYGADVYYEPSWMYIQATWSFYQAY